MSLNEKTYHISHMTQIITVLLGNKREQGFEFEPYKGGNASLQFGQMRRYRIQPSRQFA